MRRNKRGVVLRNRSPERGRSLVLRSAKSSAKDLRGLRSSAVGDTEEEGSCAEKVQMIL